jgi:hypothetical protein
MYYVVVGETSISSVKKVNDFTIGAASTATTSLVAFATGQATYAPPTGNTLVQYLTAGAAAAQAALLAKIVVGVTTVAEVQTLLSASGALNTAVTFAAATTGAIAGSSTKNLIVLAITGSGATAVVQAWEEQDLD